MRLLVIDGNSILNRAFYGIKLLTTKDGRFTNGIYGFLNIFLRLKEECKPDCVAVAFDVKAPTFRHKMYDGYKAQRKGMPNELAEQLPVLKELLAAIGYVTIEKEGFEADDILGTLAAKCGDECFLATGDRDSLQLVSDKTTVLLATTKMGQAQSTVYTPDKIKEDYGVEPEQLIEIKALMGDSSDNIPGAAGIGQKTAGELIKEFGNIDYIYENIDTLPIKDTVREKLKASKDNVFLSRVLGTIDKNIPIDCEITSYLKQQGNPSVATKMFAELEMFSMPAKFGLDGTVIAEKTEQKKKIKFIDDADFNEVLAKVKEYGKLYFTAGYKDGDICDIYISVEDNIFYFEYGNFMFSSFLQELFGDESIEKYTDDSKALYTFGGKTETNIQNVKMDTGLAGYVLNPSANDYSVIRLAQEYGVSTYDIDGCTEEKLSKAQSACAMALLCEKLSALISSNNQEYLFYDVEMPLARVLASMETIGFEVDAGGIRAFGEKLDIRIEELLKMICEEVGYEFNVNSPKQLGEALFVKLGLPARKKTKSGYSTNAEVLEDLANEHPVVEKVLEYRTIAKLKSTYCDGLLKVVAADGRIHSTFNQTETRTGRISSTEPNLQNIPVRQELGRELRKFFNAKDGCMLLDADYSQIELRVLADIANDETMIEAFNDNLDIHTITASQVFNMPIEMVTPLMRSRAKAVNFGIVYGIGAFSLAKDIGVTRAEADRYIKGYLHHYSGVNNYMEKVIKEAKENGYAKTVFERRRALPELTASNGMLRAFGERVARNMPIQGTAADIIKIAMIRVYNRLKEEGLEAKLILQVHDELIIEAPYRETEVASKILKEEMENACKMKVVLRADVNMGKTWYDAKG